MLRHYLTAALRHFLRHKVTTILNVACLSFGLMCFLGVYGFVAYLRGSDSHIPEVDRVFAVSQQAYMPGSTPIRATSPSTAWPLAQHLKSDFPELEAVARLTNASPSQFGASLKAGVIGMDAKVRFADPEIVGVLHLPLLAGTQRALETPRSIVISRDAASRLFGGPDRALGRDVVLFGSTPLTVTGVLDDIPQPSHLSTKTPSNPFQRFDVLVSMDVYEARQSDPQALRSWRRVNLTTYVVFPGDGSLTREQLVAQFPEFVRRHTSESGIGLELGLVPLSYITTSYFDGGLRALGTGVDGATLLYLLGALVLLIACLNYSNLAVSHSATRAKEIGLHRCIGAGRRQIMVQHLVEAGIVSACAAVLAVSMLLLLLVAIPLFAHTLNIADFVARHILGSAELWSTVAATLLVVTLVAGAYPAFVLSNVRPIHAVRAGQERSARRRAAMIVVGLQFASASFLLVTLLVMQAQSEFLRKQIFAALEDPLLILTNYADTPAPYDALRDELLRQPHVKSVTATVVPPWQIHGMGPEQLSLTQDPTATRRAALRNFVNTDFFSTLGFELVSGRVLDPARAGDDAALSTSAAQPVGNIVVDRAFVDQHGWTTHTAVGKVVYAWRGAENGEIARPLQIAGVVDSKPLSVIEFGVTANAYFLDRAAVGAIVVRVSKDDIPAALKEIDAAWNRVAPDLAIHRVFADESMNNAMWMFDVSTRVFSSLCVFALIIATLGLVGVSIHTTQRRMHEIGVRKTLGASARGVLAMLLRDFSKPIVIANLVAWPLAYVLMRAYLSIFTRSAGLTIEPFAASLALTLVIAWLAVSAQVTRAAFLKPVEVLRYE